MKTTAFLAACAAAASLAGAARAADYVSIVQETDLAVPAATAWDKLKGYCDIGKWLNTTCEITSGTDGELGAVRKIAGRIEEVIVARTPLSYTYADPNQPILYHGTVEIRPVSDKASKLVYSLFYDQTTIPEATREANKAGRTKMFGNVMQVMKGIAEAK
ncbi:SRPBCC family protein [Phenylobacterium sp.]|uniref:SRPBCC family protein n=1 Tax=Phenylobacterium sp. TaxID=1871053 RepID=UPI0025F4240D|nr:SRPBCC family protein [Phenylobacterium sp.]